METEEYRREQMNVLCNHYGNQTKNVYQDDSTSGEAIISMLKQEIKFQDFICTFDELAKELNDQARKQAQQKVLKGEIKQKDLRVFKYNQTKPEQRISNMCSEAFTHIFSNNMKLLSITHSTINLRLRTWFLRHESSCLTFA